MKNLKNNVNKLNYNNLKKYNLHKPAISEHSSIIARDPKIRKMLKQYQINFSKINKNCCIEGRDISTKILPNSDLKFFFKCNLNTAASRRYRELKRKKFKIQFKEVKKALRIRNFSDIKRKHSPLLKHRNSVVIDTGKLNKISMLVEMSKHIDRVLKKYEK